MFKKRAMSLFEILIGVGLIAGSTVMLSAGFSFFTNKRFRFVENYKFRLYSESVFYDILRYEYMADSGIDWFSFDSQKEIKFDLGIKSLEILKNKEKKFLLNISFKRAFQLPVSNSAHPWKRGIIAKVSFLNEFDGSVIASFERLVIMERIIRKNTKIVS